MITENGKGCKIIIVGPMCQGVGYVEIHSAEPVCYTVLKTYYGYFVCTLEDCMFAVVLAKLMKHSISHFYLYCLHNRNLLNHVIWWDKHKKGYTEHIYAYKNQ